MKILLVAVVVLIACVVVFVVGVVAPRNSRKLQARAGKSLRKAESKSDRSGGKLGDMTSDSLDKARKAVNASARKGREIHKRTTGTGS